MPENKETGLALSGGGFRATLFHLGALWRLNELAILPEIDKVSSVSGSAILSGLMAVQWPTLTFENSVASNFQEKIADPIWAFCSRNVDVPAALLGIISGTWKLEKSYRALVGTTTLKEMPDQPEFIFNAAHIETGRNCTISKQGIHTWRLGDNLLADIPIAKAIAASSAFPPAFPPVIIKNDPKAFTKSAFADLFHRDDLKRNMSLTDGGAYDNLGYHAIREYATILISDAGSPLRATHGKWFARQFNHRIMRPMETAIEQTRALRRQHIMEELKSCRKKGTLWDIRTHLGNYPIQSPFPIKPGWNQELSAVRTRLNAFTEQEKARLINWGYILCDLSIRSYYRKGTEQPRSLPFPQFGFEQTPTETK